MYVSLHNRSCYSFGSALTTPEDLVAFASHYGMPAIALTDLDGLYGAIPFYQMCRKAGVRPVIGVELPLQCDMGWSPMQLVPLTLLARGVRGYGNLCQLISLRKLRDETLRAKDLREYAEDVICLTRGVSRETAGVIRDLRDVFGPSLYIELAIHDPDDTARARRLANTADELDLPVVATCESRCLDRNDTPVLRAFQSIGTLTLLDQPHPDKPPGTWHLRTPEEMQRLFHRRPDALANTLKIAEQCEFELDLDRNRFPPSSAPAGKTAMQHLRDLCVAGCRWRYVDTLPQTGMDGKRPTFNEALQRLDRELTIIDQVHYAEYFLIFHEIVQYCRSQGISSLARGSAADSLICYALGVSHACPFRFDLPFDRFLNPERAKFSKMADIDLDLPWDQRDQVIRWVFDRWGHDHVAMIGLPNTFHARAAVAELGKVFGLPAQEVHKATKLLPHTAAWNVGRAIRQSPEARDFPITEEPYRTILQMAGRLEGLPHHWAMHPCGIVVSPEPLTELIPVQRSPKSHLVAQYDMDTVETMGFIKIDLLGQAGLSVLRDAVASIRDTERREIDLHTDIDYADPATWHMIATGGARGVHHIESPAMTSLLRQCNCRDIDCLTAIVAIIRPGAANQGKKELYARRHQGFEPPQYAHPSLVPVLDKTYGLMVFEEHILQIATEFAGMNLGRADVLRRALNKENHRLIGEMRDEFRECARRLGRTEDEIAAVWAQVDGFTGFMFNKAHSAEYAVEAFQGAWLKLRWPGHYIAAILSNYRGFYSHSPTLPQILYVLEAMRLGYGFLPPCVNRSGPRFCVEAERRRGDKKTDAIESRSVAAGSDSLAHRTIRVPIMHIKGLPGEFIARYQAERNKGVFESLDDFLVRCRPAEAEALALLDSGAFGCFGAPRPCMFWRIRRFLNESSASTACAGIFSRTLPRGDPLAQTSSHDDDLSRIDLTMPDLWQIAQREMDLLGFPISIDPLTFLGRDDQGRHIDWSQYVPVNGLDHYYGRHVTICGLMIADRVNLTTEGESMKFLSLADRTGVVETFLFPDTYRRFGHLTAAHPILAATGIVESFTNHNGYNIRITEVSVPQMRPPPGQ
jgi:DNA-directed DNA polymerase III PolC